MDVNDSCNAAKLILFLPFLIYTVYGNVTHLHAFEWQRCPSAPVSGTR
jgi:hypothetical protein